MLVDHFNSAKPTLLIVSYKLKPLTFKLIRYEQNFTKKFLITNF